MSRADAFSIWYSRKRLLSISVLLAFLTIALNLYDDSVFDNFLNENGETSFNEDVDYAFETLNYMYDLQKGKAEIRPVVEKSREVVAYWRCGLRLPVTIQNGSWLHSDGLHIFSATYDRRQNSLYPSNHVLQVLAVSFKSIKKKCFCNIYSLEDSRTVVVEGTVREIWQRAWDPRNLFYYPNLISCPLPNYFKNSKALAVSVVGSRCKSSETAIWIRKNVLPSDGKRGVAVCVKGLDFLSDMSKRLVEWIEAQYLLGADHITVYNYYVPVKTQQVLDHYAKKERFTLVPLTLPGESPNHIVTRSHFIWRNRQQKRRHELIPYNDCFYRHIDTHKYILIIDIDELIVPLKSRNWIDMLDSLIGNHTKHQVTSISIQNVFKFPSSFSLHTKFPEYMYMLRNRYMSKEISKPGDYGKSFTNTDSVATVFNHFALHRLHDNVWKTIYATEDVALKLHYKQNCPIESRKDCSRYWDETVEDTSLDRFAGKLIKRVSKVLNDIHLFTMQGTVLINDSSVPISFPRYDVELNLVR